MDARGRYTVCVLAIGTGGVLYDDVRLVVATLSLKEAEYQVTTHRLSDRSALRLHPVHHVGGDVLSRPGSGRLLQARDLSDGDGLCPGVDGVWPPAGIETFDPWHLPLINTLILLLSGCTVTWAHHALVHAMQPQGPGS